MIGGREVGADVGELVRKLVDELGVVAVLTIEADRDFSARGPLIKSDGALMMP